MTKSCSHKSGLLCLLDLLDGEILGKEEETDGATTKDKVLSTTLALGEETPVLSVAGASKAGFTVGEMSLGSMNSKTENIGLEVALRCLKGKISF